MMASTCPTCGRPEMPLFPCCPPPSAPVAVPAAPAPTVTRYPSGARPVAWEVWRPENPGRWAAVVLVRCTHLRDAAVEFLRYGSGAVSDALLPYLRRVVVVAGEERSAELDHDDAADFARAVASTEPELRLRADRLRRLGRLGAA